MAKKHLFQMTEDEQRYLMRKVGGLNIDRFTKHSNMRMEDRDITTDDVKKTLKDYRIIEYKMDSFNKQTVLIQSNKRIKGNYINIVVGLNNNSVITCFKNTCKSWDLDLTGYNERLDIRNLVKNDVKLRTGYFGKSNKRGFRGQ